MFFFFFLNPNGEEVSILLLFFKIKFLPFIHEHLSCTEIPEYKYSLSALTYCFISMH